MTEEMKKHFEYEMKKQNEHAQRMRLVASSLRDEAKEAEDQAEKAAVLAAQFKALLEPGDTVTVTLKVDTTQAEKDIARTRIAVEQLASQFNSVSAGGNTLLTAAS